MAYETLTGEKETERSPLSNNICCFNSVSIGAFTDVTNRGKVVACIYSEAGATVRIVCIIIAFKAAELNIFFQGRFILFSNLYDCSGIFILWNTEIDNFEKPVTDEEKRRWGDANL